MGQHIQYDELIYFILIGIKGGVCFENSFWVKEDLDCNLYITFTFLTIV